MQFFVQKRFIVPEKLNTCPVETEDFLREFKPELEFCDVGVLF